MKKSLVILALFASALIGQTIATWNGVTMGSSAGEAGKFDGITIGQSAGNVSAINGAATPGGGGGTPAWVQDASNSFDPYGASRTIALTGVAAGSTLVGMYDGSDLPITCTASGHTFTTHTTTYFGVCSAYSSTGGDITVTIAPASSSVNAGRIVLMEISNIASSSPFDQECGASGFVANQNCTTGTLAQASEFIIGMVSTNASVTAGSGYTLRAAAGSFKTETKDVSATTAVNVGFTHAESTSTVQGVTFKGN